MGLKKRDEIQSVPMDEALKILKNIARDFALSFGLNEEVTFDEASKWVSSDDPDTKIELVKNRSGLTLIIRKRHFSMRFELICRRGDQNTVVFYEATIFGERGFKWLKITYNKYKQAAGNWAAVNEKLKENNNEAD